MPTFQGLIRTKEGSPRDSLRLAGTTAHKTSGPITNAQYSSIRAIPAHTRPINVVHEVDTAPSSGVITADNPLFRPPMPCIFLAQSVPGPIPVLAADVNTLVPTSLPQAPAPACNTGALPTTNYATRSEETQKKAHKTLQTDTVEYFDRYCTYVDMPGITEKDLKIEIDSNCIIVKGNRKLHYPHNIGVLFKERFSGPFRIVIPFVPEKVDSSHISAYIENGVLIVTLKKFHGQH